MNSSMFIILVALSLYVLYVTKVFNFWGMGRGSSKVKSDIRKERANLRNARFVSSLMRFFVWFDNAVGFGRSIIREEDYRFKIDRLNLLLKPLGRLIKPNELSGLLKVIQFIGLLFGVVLSLLSGVTFGLVFLLLVFAPAIFNTFASAKISSADEYLEQEFPDMFIVLYSRLVKGTSTRLAPTLRDYLASLDSVELTKSKKVMKGFITDLRNNIEIYGDDSLAITNLRIKYRSAIVVNFCNLASQALSGVDNYDKLLSFKIELNSKKVAMMDAKATKLVQWGSRAVWVVYALLFQFILLSWVAKLSLLGGLGGIVGL